MHQYFSNLWGRLPLVARLLATAGISLVAAGAIMLFVSTQQEISDARSDLKIELAQNLETLPPALADIVVLGDFASLQQTLDRYVTRPLVGSVSFTDESGKALQSIDKPHAHIAPDWFIRDFHEISGKAAVSVGGRNYGTIVVTLKADNMVNRAWRRLLNQLAILVLALGFDLIAIWWVLRNGMAPLKRLEEGADSLAGGALETRLASEGSPELRHLISSFNGMAEATQRAQERLLLANADLQRFAEVTAHHLQEPARRIATYAGRLANQMAGKINDDEAQFSLDLIGVNAARLQEMLIDVERYLAADQARGVVQALEVGRLLEALMKKLEPRLVATHAEIKLGALPAVLLDMPRLNDVFSIIIDNALAHAPTTHPLTIAVSGEQNAGRVCYRISDNGNGIEAQYRERVFRVFEKLSASSTGTGIGLAILRRIAESTGGRAWIEEAPGGGCSVLIDLPAGEKI